VTHWEWVFGFILFKFLKITKPLFIHLSSLFVYYKQEDHHFSPQLGEWPEVAFPLR
jgi:hypothetical protein